jgi:hypothetical protein
MLGFELQSSPDRGPFEWASLVRDGVQIVLQRSPGYVRPDLQALRPGGVWDAYLRVGDLGNLYQELIGKGAIWSKMRRQVYGMFEFDVRDPNGYLLVLAEPVQPRRQVKARLIAPAAARAERR